MGHFENVVKVGISEMNVVKAPWKIRTTGLGSCVGLVIYDDVNKLAGLAHIMLPDSSLSNKEPLNCAKYADTDCNRINSSFKKLWRKHHVF